MLLLTQDDKTGREDSGSAAGRLSVRANERERDGRSGIEGKSSEKYTH